MHLSELLHKYQFHIDYHKSEEYKAIIKYRNKLLASKIINSFKDDDNSFSLIVGFAIVNAYLNKLFIENASNHFTKESISKMKYIDKSYVDKEVKKKIIASSLPYFVIDKHEYYVPIFSRSINLIYSEEQHKLNEAPYDTLKENFNTAIIDLFEVYNFALFDSNFTRLIKIKSCDNVTAFYHPFFRTLYFINDQGRLDYYLPLFDKFLKKISTSNINKRLVGVVDAYFALDKEKMIAELIANKLVSDKLLYRVIPNKYKNKKI